MPTKLRIPAFTYSKYSTCLKVLSVDTKKKIQYLPKIINLILKIPVLIM